MKKFLTNNKIYFETLAMVLLGVMSVIVTCNSNRIATQQTELSKSSIQPRFGMNIYPANYDTTRMYFKDTNLDLYCYEGSYENLTTSTITFLNVNYEKLGEWKSFEIPLNGYFLNNFKGETKLGLVRMLRCYENLRELNDFEAFVSSILRENKMGALFTTQCYLTLNYLDIENVEHTKYYDVSFREGILIGEDEGMRKFLDHSNALKEGRLFSTYRLREEQEKLKEHIRTKILH